MKLTEGIYTGLHIDECPSAYILFLVDHGRTLKIQNSAAKEYRRRTSTQSHTEEVRIKIGDSYK